ncbi:hypothetical protein AQPE_3717 [Aquipluma nitroreducens]|uniref:Uncharacterized protein n=1 Tax=Aquipluma nitroreducens TaxID=2010828 RepID=A0A5K7SD50_9BACT|nr:hypothetical protein AQPE_3717 [Aquipluma nitroreducens]
MIYIPQLLKFCNSILNPNTNLPDKPDFLQDVKQLFHLYFGP